MASVLLDMSENIFAVCPSKFQCFRGRLVAAAIIEILSLFDQGNYSFIKEKLGNFEKWGLWRSFYVSRDSTSGEKDRACHWQAPFHARLKRVSTSGESMSIRVRVYRRLRAASGRGWGGGGEEEVENHYSGLYPVLFGFIQNSIFIVSLEWWNGRDTQVTRTHGCHADCKQ